MSKVYTLDEWNSLISSGACPEKKIKQRMCLHLINLECPTCSSHLWEGCENHESEANELELEVKCLACGFHGFRKVAKSE